MFRRLTIAAAIAASAVAVAAPAASADTGATLGSGEPRDPAALTIKLTDLIVTSVQAAPTATRVQLETIMVSSLKAADPGATAGLLLPAVQRPREQGNR